MNLKRKAKKIFKKKNSLKKRKYIENGIGENGRNQ
jgi:hypothetical protein